MRRAFTLIELLVVISIIALLIAILLPALSAARDSAKSMQCSSIIRQLATAQTAYATDKNGEFSPAIKWVWGLNTLEDGSPFPNRWDPTVLDGVKAGQLYPYLDTNENINLCPIAVDALDSSTFPASWQNDRLARNYVANWQVGPIDPLPYATEELTMDSIARPSDLVLFAEENTFTIPGYSRYTMNDGFLFGVINVDCFASFHNTSGGDRTTGDSNASFADGHVEFVNYRQPEPFVWTDPGTGSSRTVTATEMWCTDAIPVQR